jgi:hypothetical protein
MSGRWSQAAGGGDGPWIGSRFTAAEILIFKHPQPLESIDVYRVSH